MKRAKRRFQVRFKNDLGSGILITFKKREKAEEEIQYLKKHDDYDRSCGYKDIHNEYWIEETVIY